MSVCGFPLPACADSANLLCFSRDKDQAHPHPSRCASVGGFAGGGQHRGQENSRASGGLPASGSPRLRGPGCVSGSKATWMNSDDLHITGLEPEDQAVIKIQDGAAAIRLTGSDPRGQEPSIAPPPAPAPTFPQQVQPLLVLRTSMELGRDSRCQISAAPTSPWTLSSANVTSSSSLQATIRFIYCSYSHYVHGFYKQNFLDQR